MPYPRSIRARSATFVRLAIAVGCAKVTSVVGDEAVSRALDAEWTFAPTTVDDVEEGHKHDNAIVTVGPEAWRKCLNRRDSGSDSGTGHSGGDSRILCSIDRLAGIRTAAVRQ